ncbi:hypothetical protein CVT26_015564 [Gymnopilus dilepis]|uniref:RRM domain-containing protein n=1 Tax=Gymnopilus dilepis TaxID=231916 RepID=A0A409XYM4_9AGAR|nr:hypothetical protein CVT26_015564 [Gymnopilus dilepis]
MDRYNSFHSIPPRGRWTESDYPPGLEYSSLRSLHELDGPLSAAHQKLASGAPTGAPRQQDRRTSNTTASTTSESAYDSSLSLGLAPRPLDLYSASPFEQLGGGPNTNRHNSTFSNTSSFLSFNHQSSHRPSPPPLPATASTPTAAIYPSSSPSDRDPLAIYRQPQPSAAAQNVSAAANSLAVRSTLWWGELEPWMDEEYAKQVCGLMGWEPASIKVPHPAPDPATGQQANNPGYCFLTFPSPAHAASVLAQISKGPNGNGGPLQMPNSSKPFVMNWASAVTSASPLSNAFPASVGSQPPAAAQQQYPKEYSIFVGDLAPETSNSDLVAVFRNPILGLRNDREPKFIKPFLSCKSAKIMLDPVTGVSRGYGFVRFTDEADQQRALIEMHGLYCLSRPMRISPATAKFKPPQQLPSFELPQVSFTPPANIGTSSDASGQPVTIALPLPNAAQAKSVSAPIAAAGSNLSLSSNAASNSTSSGSSFGGSNSNNSLSSGTSSSGSISTSAFTSSSDDMLNSVPTHSAPRRTWYDPNQPLDTSPLSMKMASALDPMYEEAQLRQVLAQQAVDPSPRYVISAESWKHQAQARAILGNLIGPNGEQLTSTDPYNTTVFVGGLSPLISEDTLRTFFAPFGDIHYVKVPVGKHCGFVQFVRKADAERAIEKMQGFPIGGSRIRLSWGRSQYKAAQAAAQAAQAAALQSQFSLPQVPSGAISHDQALQILQKFSAQGYFGSSNGSHSPTGANAGLGGLGGMYDLGGQNQDLESLYAEYGFSPGVALGVGEKELQGQAGLGQGLGQGQGLTGASLNSGSTYTSATAAAGAASQRPDLHRHSSFSPFSPDPNNLYMSSESVGVRRDTSSPFSSRLDGGLPHPSKAYAPGFYPISSQSQQAQQSSQQLQHSQQQQQQDLKVNTATSAVIGNGPTAGTGTGKVSPTSVGSAIGRPGSGSSGGRYGFGDNSDPPTPLHRPTAPISRPSSGQMGVVPGSAGAGAAGTGESDAIQDLNGTLASLDLDRDRSASSSWKSSDVTSGGSAAKRA